MSDGLTEYNQFGNDSQYGDSSSSNWAGILPTSYLSSSSHNTSPLSPRISSGQNNPDIFATDNFLLPSSNDSIGLDPSLTLGFRGLLHDPAHASHSKEHYDLSTSTAFDVGLKNFVSINIPSYTTECDSEGKYTLFTIVVQTAFSSAEIRRRYKNFLNLHQDLMHRIPKVMLPPFPKKKRLGTLEPSFVEERRVALERYLKELAALREAWSCPRFVEFLDNSHPYFGMQIQVTKLTDEVNYLRHCNGMMARQLTEATAALTASSDALSELQRRVCALEHTIGSYRGTRQLETSSKFQTGFSKESVSQRDISCSSGNFSSAVGIEFHRHNVPKSDSFSGFSGAPMQNIHNTTSAGEDVVDTSPRWLETSRVLGSSGATGYVDEAIHHSPASEVNIERHHTRPGVMSYKPESFPPTGHSSRQCIENLNTGNVTTVRTIDSLTTTESHSTLSRAFDTLLSYILPTIEQLQYRYNIEKYIAKLVRKSLGAQVYQTNIHSLRCFLPDDPISLSIYLCRGLENSWYIRLNEKLCRMSSSGISGTAAHPSIITGSLSSTEDTTINCTEKVPAKPTTSADSNSLQQQEPPSQSSHIISHVSFMNEHGEHSLQCIVGNTTVDIRANMKIDLCFVAFLEEIDRAVGGNHLFKKSLTLVRAWWTLETSAYSNIQITPLHLPDSSLCIMICAIFSRNASKITHPLHALSIFLSEYASFDWSTYGLTVYGPVLLSSLRNDISITEACSTLCPDSLIGSHIINKYEALLKESSIDGAGPDRSTPTADSDISVSAEPSGSIPLGIFFDKVNDDFHKVDNTPHLSSEYVKIFHPLDPSTNTVPDAMGLKFAEVMTEILKAGESQMCEIFRLEKSLQNSTDDRSSVNDLEAAVFLMFQETKKRYGDGWRPDVAGADIVTRNTVSKGPIGGTLDSSTRGVSNSSPFFSDCDASQDDFMNELGSDFLSSPLETMWEQIRYCNFLLGAQITESTLRTLSKDILQERGPLPVGEIGKMLQEITCISTLSAYLKDKFGGLKKFLENFVDDFVISTDHPFNPHVFLLQTLSSDELKSITQGVIPPHLTTKAGKRVTIYSVVITS